MKRIKGHMYRTQHISTKEMSSKVISRADLMQLIGKHPTKHDIDTISCLLSRVSLDRIVSKTRDALHNTGEHPLRQEEAIVNVMSEYVLAQWPSPS